MQLLGKGMQIVPFQRPARSLGWDITEQSAKSLPSQQAAGNSRSDEYDSDQH
jgi:hypothetical protein